MNQNIEKILYLGAGLLLFALALTAFFSYYDHYQDYIHQGEKFMLEDTSIYISEESVPLEAIGPEVLHQVLEKRKRDETTRLYSHYGSMSTPSGIVCPEILVEGVKAMDLDLSLFNQDQSFYVVYEIDPSGEITLIHYVKK